MKTFSSSLVFLFYLSSSHDHISVSLVFFLSSSSSHRPLGWGVHGAHPNRVDSGSSRRDPDVDISATTTRRVSSSNEATGGFPAPRTYLVTEKSASSRTEDEKPSASYSTLSFLMVENNEEQRKTQGRRAEEVTTKRTVWRERGVLETLQEAANVVAGRLLPRASFLGVRTEKKNSTSPDDSNSTGTTGSEEHTEEHTEGTKNGTEQKTEKKEEEETSSTTGTTGKTSSGMCGCVKKKSTTFQNPRGGTCEVKHSSSKIEGSWDEADVRCANRLCGPPVFGQALKNALEKKGRSRIGRV